jgi:Aldehyde dehydrogenase family
MVAPSAFDFEISENVMSDYPQTQLYIGDVWRDGSNERLSIVDPASDEIIGTVANAGRDDLDEALAAASAGFNIWREISGFERSKVLRNAAQLLRDGVEKIATIMTLEQGKPIAESRSETLEAANTIDWFAEEARRAYGRVVPARSLNVRQIPALSSQGSRRCDHPATHAVSPNSIDGLRSHCTKICCCRCARMTMSILKGLQRIQFFGREERYRSLGLVVSLETGIFSRVTTTARVQQKATPAN